MRTEELEKVAKRRKLDLVLVANQANIRALTGINCDNAILQTFQTFQTFQTCLHRLQVCADGTSRGAETEMP